MAVKKILLLNPPGKNLYIRDYYCSKTSQADYILPPVDLIAISGRLQNRFEVRLIDAVVDKMSPEKCLAAAYAFAPDAVVFLAGAASWDEDKIFLAELADRLAPGTKFIGSGDILRDDLEKRFAELPCLDAAVLDFTNADALKIIDGDFGNLENAVVRVGDGIARYSAAPRSGETAVPIPMHGLFVSKNYRHPFARRRKFASVLSEYGCPYDCSFCIIGTLGYKRRPVENVVEEIKSVTALGVREIFFATQTFGVSKKYTLRLCSELAKLSVGWFTFSRVDVADEEILAAMRGAGCHTVIFGVESGSDAILSKYRKGYDRRRIAETLSVCRRLGMTTVGTFIIGLPDDTKYSLAETLEFIKTLPLDYASFNVAVPRHGTRLRERALSDRLIDENFSTMDQSGSRIAMATSSLSRADVLDYRRKMVSAFYLNPRWLLRRLLGIRSPRDFFSQIKHGISLIMKTWSGKDD